MMSQNSGPPISRNAQSVVVVWPISQALELREVVDEKHMLDAQADRWANWHANHPTSLQRSSPVSLSP